MKSKFICTPPSDAAFLVIRSNSSKYIHSLFCLCLAVESFQFIAISAVMTSTDSSTEQFAAGIRGFLEPALRSCDQSIMEVLQSQEALSGQIDRLSNGKFLVYESVRLRQAAMQTFSGLSTTPPLYTYTKKLTNARRRLFAVNTTLSGVLERLERLANTHLPRAPPQAAPETMVRAGASSIAVTDSDDRCRGALSLCGQARRQLFCIYIKIRNERSPNTKCGSSRRHRPQSTALVAAGSTSASCRDKISSLFHGFLRHPSNSSVVLFSVCVIHVCCLRVRRTRGIRIGQK